MELNEFADNHFIRNIIEDYLKKNKNKKIITRFPPEPNGYLHVGHVKSICLNFGLAYIYNGKCNLRFDDTNPEKESEEYVNSIKEDINWLGFKWSGNVKFASNYFDALYKIAHELIDKGLAYVDDLSYDEIKEYRGTLKQQGKDSPFRDRSIKENKKLFTDMKDGKFSDGSKTLRLKIDMQSGNINLRDPIIYRIRKVTHHRLLDKWCIYPLYDFTHAISDAIEKVTHSLCTLEFEDHRSLYDWIIKNSSIFFIPHQYEFSRLELLYTVTSKRKLKKLVEEGYVNGWDDPRLITISGMRRRGYTPEGLRLFCKRIGISKSANIVDFSILENAIRDDLSNKVPRMFAVLNPLKIELINFDNNIIQSRYINFHPEINSFGDRKLQLTKFVYIEKDDFMLNPVLNWKRLQKGGEVRLRYSYIIKCQEVVLNSKGEVILLKCFIDYNTLGRNPEDRKVKGVIHWLSETNSIKSKVRIYDRLFLQPRPDMIKNSNGEVLDFCNFINDNSFIEKDSLVESIAKDLKTETRYQFERLGYFITDRYDHCKELPVFNKIVSLKDTWQKVN